MQDQLECLTLHLLLDDHLWTQQPLEIPHNQYSKEVKYFNPCSLSASHRLPFISNNIWQLFPKVDMNNFDGSNGSGWVTHMEHYFSLHGIIDDMMKLQVGVLYLEVELEAWWCGSY